MSGRWMRGPVAAGVVGSLVVAAVLSLATSTQAADACAATVAAPTLEVEPGPVALAEAVTVSGEGWCHPTDGGSTVAIKIDEGAFSHLDTSIHANKTIWAVVEADASDGTFSFEMALPDGTTATSRPAMGEGTHTLRALSGSIKPDDTVRTVTSDDFVVGEYKPNGAAELVGPDDLEATAQDEVLVVWRTGRLLLSVESGRDGDWIQPSLLATDGSARRPWGTDWFRLDAAGRVLLPTAAGDFEDDFTIVVQSGNEADHSAVIGWSVVTFPRSTESGEDGNDSDKGDDSGSERPKKKHVPDARQPATSPQPRASVPRPLVPAATIPSVAVPAAAAPLGTVLPASMSSAYHSWAAMLVEDELSSSLEGTTLRMQLGYDSTLPATGGDLYVHVHTDSDQQPAGWTVSSLGGEVLLDLSGLAPGVYRFSLQSATGKPVGWAQASVSGTASTISTDPAATDVDAIRTAQAEKIGERDVWLSGVGLALLTGLGFGASVGRLTARTAQTKGADA